MTDTPATPAMGPDDTPPGTEWVLVKHSRFPIPSDEVIGRYPSRADAFAAYTNVYYHRQWWTEYSVERRNKG